MASGVFTGNHTPTLKVGVLASGVFTGNPTPTLKISEGGRPSILQYRTLEPEYGSDEFPDVENAPETALYGDKAIAELQ